MSKRPEQQQNPVVATNTDITLECKDCHSQFLFTIGEQEFYQSKGFTPPVRCPDCRQKRKAEKEKRMPRY